MSFPHKSPPTRAAPTTDRPCYLCQDARVTYDVLFDLVHLLLFVTVDIALSQAIDVNRCKLQ